MAVAERWKEYCHELYSHTPKFDPNILDSLKNKQIQTEEPSILREEVEEAIRRLKNGKAAGIDNIPGELIHNGGKPVIDVLHRLCEQIWRTNAWPKQWVQYVIIPLPKKGNLRKCENYRTISLVSHPSKVLLRVLLNRLQPQVESCIADEQAGFRAGRSTIEPILNLRTLCEKYVEHNMPL